MCCQLWQPSASRLIALPISCMGPCFVSKRVLCRVKPCVHAIIFSSMRAQKLICLGKPMSLSVPVRLQRLVSIHNLIVFTVQQYTATSQVVGSTTMTELTLRVCKVACRFCSISLGPASGLRILLQSCDIGSHSGRPWSNLSSKLAKSLPHTDRSREVCQLTTTAYSLWWLHPTRSCFSLPI